MNIVKIPAGHECLFDDQKVVDLIQVHVTVNPKEYWSFRFPEEWQYSDAVLRWICDRLKAENPNHLFEFGRIRNPTNWESWIWEITVLPIR